MGREEQYSSLTLDDKDPLIKFLHKVIRLGVKVLAVLMAMVILWGIGDVIWVIYVRLATPPYFLLKMSRLW